MMFASQTASACCPISLPCSSCLKCSCGTCLHVHTISAGDDNAFQYLTQLAGDAWGGLRVIHLAIRGWCWNSVKALKWHVWETADGPPGCLRTQAESTGMSWETILVSHIMLTWPRALWTLRLVIFEEHLLFLVHGRVLKENPSAAFIEMQVSLQPGKWNSTTAAY